MQRFCAVVLLKAFQIALPSGAGWSRTGRVADALHVMYAVIRRRLEMLQAHDLTAASRTSACLIDARTACVGLKALARRWDGTGGRPHAPNAVGRLTIGPAGCSCSMNSDPPVCDSGRLKPVHHERLLQGLQPVQPEHPGRLSTWNTSLGTDALAQG